MVELSAHWGGQLASGRLDRFGARLGSMFHSLSCTLWDFCRGLEYFRLEGWSMRLPMVVFSKGGQVHAIDVFTHCRAQGVRRQIAMSSDDLTRHSNDSIKRSKPI